MRVLSLFSGIGGFDLGLERAGMTVVAQAENDPYCLRQLARHWPGVARYEDVRDVGSGTYEVGAGGGLQREGRWDSSGDRIDLICGGFPCQDVSVAGKRAGLDGERSGLWFEFQRIVSELRPAYVLVENVPGLLSSADGRDFGTVITGLGELGYAVSWAVLDSQHFGVPQRRRRVFIVAGPDPESTEAILSLSEGCGGHPGTRRAAGEDVANTLGGGSAESSRGFRDDLDTSTYIANTIDANIGTKQWLDDQNVEDFLPVMDAIAHTLRADGFDASEDGTGRGTPLVAGTVTQRSGAHTGNSNPIADNLINVAQPLRSNRWGGSDSHGDEGNAVMQGAAVRRLTPVECARLQGFPDDWLDGADGPQYRALGNAVTVPVIEWIGRRMMAVEAAR